MKIKNHRKSMSNNHQEALLAPAAHLGILGFLGSLLGGFKSTPVRPSDKSTRSEKTVQMLRDKQAAKLERRHARNLRAVEKGAMIPVNPK